jgi:hypothetical protein
VYAHAGYGQTAELHAFMAHGAALGIAESVDKLLVNLGEVKPTVLFSVPVLFKKVYDGIHAKVSVYCYYHYYRYCYYCCSVALYLLSVMGNTFHELNETCTIKKCSEVIHLLLAFSSLDEAFNAVSVYLMLSKIILAVHQFICNSCSHCFMSMLIHMH